MTASIYTAPATSVVPPQPAGSAETLCNLVQNLKNNRYIHTGLFFKNGSMRPTKQNLAKITNLFFDIDYKDLFTWDDELRTTFASGAGQLNISIPFESPFTPAQLAEGLTDVEQALLDEAQLKHEIKLAEETLRMMGSDRIRSLLEGRTRKAVEALTAIIGKKPNRVVYSGHGSHVHFWVSDLEGWTEEGSDIAQGLEANAKAFLDRYPTIVEEANNALQGATFDANVKNLGERKCPDIGFTNNKVATNPKPITSWLEDLCDMTTRVVASDLPAASKSSRVSGFAASVAGVRNSAGDGSARSMPTPKLIEDGFQFLIPGENGTAITMTAKQIRDEWDTLTKITGANGEHKLKCRPITDVPTNPQNAGNPFNGFLTMDTDAKRLRCTVLLSENASKDYIKGEHWGYNKKGDKQMGLWVYDAMPITLLRNPKTQALLDNVTNYTTIFTQDSAVNTALMLNTRLQRIYVNRTFHLLTTNDEGQWERAKTTEWFPLIDAHYTQFARFLETTYGVRSAKKDTIRDAVKLAARQSSRDPVREYLADLEWDGIDRLGDAGGVSWINEMLHLPKDHKNAELYKHYSIAVALAVVHSIMCVDEPTDVQHFLCFTGPQGIGKSAFAKIFALTEHLIPGTTCDDYFSDRGVRMGGNEQRDSLMEILGRFVIECPEAISSSSGATVKDIKAFTTGNTMVFRRPYESEVTTHHKATYLITNSNDENFLTDETGNRRYLIIDCFNDLFTEPDGGELSRLDLKWLRANIEQIYAQAYERAYLGKNIPASAETRMWRGRTVQQWNLPVSINGMQEAHNQKFMVETALSVAIRSAVRYFEQKGKYDVPFAELKAKIKEADDSLTDARISNHATKHIANMGWKKRRTAKGMVWTSPAPRTTTESFDAEPASDRPDPQGEPRSEQETTVQPTAETAPAEPAPKFDLLAELSVGSLLSSLK